MPDVLQQLGTNQSVIGLVIAAFVFLFIIVPTKHKPAVIVAALCLVAFVVGLPLLAALTHLH